MMTIPIERVNMLHRVLLVGGTLIGLWLNGCSDNRSIDSPVASMGSASDIKDKLATTQALRGTNIEVNTRNGKNILSGFVHTQKQKFLAGSVARSVEGSGIVVNQLVVQ
ncbi:MAG: BON domain-containing protein [Epsilonproteobacteria bacterium]|nr:MAG: BON domain-containing protein [Campylobacterota bacterium]